MKIDAILSPPEIDLLPQRDLRATTCIIFDVLRATSSIVTGLANGVREIFPVCTIEEALALKERLPAALLGGERHGDRIDGFDLGNSPLEYRDKIADRIITTTTNGTVALRACEAADAVWAGALLNMDALAARLRKIRPENVLMVCAGTFRDLALEDVFAAGMLTTRFPEAELTDGARTALALFQTRASDPIGLLQESKNGRVLASNGRDGDVRWCAQCSIYDAVGVMTEGAIRTANAVLSVKF